MSCKSVFFLEHHLFANLNRNMEYLLFEQNFSTFPYYFMYSFYRTDQIASKKQP